MSKTVFISDLHLSEHEPQLIAIFKRFLKQCLNEHVDSLYILGDFFEAWIGDDNDEEWLTDIKSFLHTMTESGLTLYFIHGNRDFLIGSRFANETGITLLPSEKVIELYGKRVLILHGDELCTLDKKYLWWRKFSRCQFFQFILFTAWPLSFRKKIARKLRRQSELRTKQLEMRMMDVTHEAVSNKLSTHQVNILIHGHTHQPNYHNINNHQTRIVLGAWHEKGHALIWYDDGRSEFIHPV